LARGPQEQWKPELPDGLGELNASNELKGKRVFRQDVMISTLPAPVNAELTIPNTNSLRNECLRKIVTLGREQARGHRCDLHFAITAMTAITCDHGNC
jgi:hypothetical protein